MANQCTAARGFNLFTFAKLPLLTSSAVRVKKLLTRDPHIYGRIKCQVQREAGKEPLCTFVGACYCGISVTVFKTEPNELSGSLSRIKAQQFSHILSCLIGGKKKVLLFLIIDFCITFLRPLHSFSILDSLPHYYSSADGFYRNF